MVMDGKFKKFNFKFCTEDVKKEDCNFCGADYVLKPQKKPYFHITINNIPFMVDEVEVGKEHLRLFKKDHMVCGTIYVQYLLKDEILIE